MFGWGMLFNLTKSPLTQFPLSWGDVRSIRRCRMSERILYAATFQKSTVAFEMQPLRAHLCSESVRCYLNLAVKTLLRLAIVLKFPARWRMQEHSQVIFPRLWLDLFKWRPLPPPWLLMFTRVYLECECTFYRLIAMFRLILQYLLMVWETEYILILFT